MEAGGAPCPLGGQFTQRGGGNKAGIKVRPAPLSTGGGGHVS